MTIPKLLEELERKMDVPVSSNEAKDADIEKSKEDR